MLLSPLSPASQLSAIDRQAYRNPIVAGDHPDPSLIRVGERDFYAVTTSNDWAPQFPILHSRDLVHWEVVSSVFRQRPKWAMGCYWAPEISEYKGRYFIYYVARRRGGSLTIAVASSEHPAGPYVDHGPLVGQSLGSIDPSPVVDSDGRRFLLWKEDGNSVKQPTPIWAQLLNEEGTKLLGEPVVLMTNDQPWEGGIVEAPIIVMRDGWFYMFYAGNACCGRECAYAMGVARARNLLGPWEKYAANPILQSNEYWRCPGHGSIVSDTRGRMFFLYHAYAAKEDSVFIGRQMMLDEIRWDGSGWPTINEGAGPSSVQAAPFSESVDGQGPSEFFDDFSGSTLRKCWQWPHVLAPSVVLGNGRANLSLTPHSSAPSADRLAAVIGRSPRQTEYDAVARLDPSLLRDAQVGLAAYGCRRKALGIAVVNHQVIVWRRREKRDTILACVPVAIPAGNRIALRMRCTQGHMYRFSFSVDGYCWQEIGPPLNGAYIPPWDAGVRVALTAGGAPGATGAFESLRIVPSKAPRLDDEFQERAMLL